jgi:UDP-glucose-4-epimerase GalE
MKSVLVAGGAGYIGAQTCKALAQAGYLPVTLDSLVTGYEKAVRWGPLVKADLRDKSAILEAIKTYDIKSAIHFAAFSLVGESVVNPAKYYDNNVSAAVDFVSTLIEGGVKSLVFSSTAATYGTPQTSLIPETHPTQPINPYGASKLAFEQALNWMGKAHGLSYTILRYFNAAGADLAGEVGESHVPESHLIPLMCKAILGTGSPLTIFGEDYPTKDGTPIRDYIHVIDLADAHIKAIERLNAGGDSQIFNVGKGEGATVLEIINTAERVLGKKVPHSIGPRRTGDPEALVADVKKLRTTFPEWTPSHSDLETIITSAFNWQKAPLY